MDMDISWRLVLVWLGVISSCFHCAIYCSYCERKKLTSPGWVFFSFFPVSLKALHRSHKIIKHDFHVLQTWLPRITSGRSRGGGPGACPPLIFRPNWGLTGRKKYFWRPPPAPYLRIWMTPAPHPPPEILVYSVYWPWRHHFAKVIQGEPRAG